MKVGLSILISVIICSCANPVSPTGGEKDIDPPKIINIDSTTKSGIVSVYFDENIKFQNNIQLNPSKTFKKAKVEIENKAIHIQIESFTNSIAFNDAINDLNENNPGKYPFILLNKDTTEFLVNYENNQSSKTKVNGYVKIDSLYYMADNSNKEQLRFEGLPSGEKEVYIYSDDNKNNQYDENESYSTFKVEEIDSIFTYLYPPKKETVFIQQKDTAKYSYLVTNSVRLRDSIEKLLDVRIHLDTLKYLTQDSLKVKEICSGQIIKKLNIKAAWQIKSIPYIYVEGKDSFYFSEYPMFYNGPVQHKPLDYYNYDSAMKYSIKKDTSVKSYRKLGKIEFQNDSNVTYRLIVYKGKTEIINYPLHSGNTSFVLPVGSFNYLLWNDKNGDKICAPGEDILNYYFGMDINAQLTNTIVVKKSKKQEKNSPNTKTILSE